MTDDAWQTKDVSDAHDYLAPDGSEIRLLLSLAAGGLAHCTLPPGGISSPVKHRSVEEIWFFLEGQGKVWRREGRDEKTVEVYAGRSLTIPSGVEFQFCNTGSDPLRFLISTMPKWPGPEEAVPLSNGAWWVK
jgi:mannose-6-phosphate isomerase-like protein (cupin superfamily)